MTEEQHGTIIILIISLVIYLGIDILTPATVSFLSVFGGTCLVLMVWNNFLKKGENDEKVD